CFFFFFQAEDGIRDLIVTGVQTCALPIYREVAGSNPVTPIKMRMARREISSRHSHFNLDYADVVELRVGAVSRFDSRIGTTARRSEERRVGKECRSRWSG